MRVEWDVVGLTYGCAEIATISGTTLETPSTPVAMQEVHNQVDNHPICSTFQLCAQACCSECKRASLSCHFPCSN